MGQTKLISPALLQRHLHKVDYPVGRDELVEHAKSECERVIATLQLFPDRTFNGPTDVARAFGELARQYVEGASYPASREDLVEHVKEENAPKPAVEALQQIPERQYHNPQQVSEAIAEEVVE
jgi:hypothetical protein